MRKGSLSVITAGQTLNRSPVIATLSPAGTGLTFIDFKVDWFSTGIEHWTFWPLHQPASSAGHWAVQDIPLMHSRSSPSLEEKSSCTKLKLLSGQMFFFLSSLPGAAGRAWNETGGSRWGSSYVGLTQVKTPLVIDFLIKTWSSKANRILSIYHSLINKCLTEKNKI